MSIALQLEPAPCVPPVEYRWDEGTEILSAEVADGPRPGAPRATGVNGSVAVEGDDGSWLTIDLDDGCVRGVQVAVWPAVRRKPALRPPAASTGRARLTLPSGTASEVVLSLEVSAAIHVEVDPGERHFHFVLGASLPALRVAIATGIILELDDRHHLRGLWLLDVPPSP